MGLTLAATPTLPPSFSPVDFVVQASAGLLSDSKHIATRAREEAQSYRDVYNAPTTLKVRLPPILPTLMRQDLTLTRPIFSQDLISRVSMYLQAYTLYSSVRPFGVSSIFGSIDRNGPQLYMIEPSGLSYGHRATAVGKGKLLAKTEVGPSGPVEPGLRRC